MTELRNQINNIVQDHQECLVLAKSVGSSEVYEGTTATEEDIRRGKTAYSNGKFVEGTLEAPDDNYNAIIDTSTQTTLNLATAITKINVLDCSSVTTLASTFKSNTSIKSINRIIAPNVTIATSMFEKCSNLVTAPEIDTSNFTEMNGMFTLCTKLVNVPVYNASKATTLWSMFLNCPNLSDESLNNIMAMCLTVADPTYEKYDNGKKLLKNVGLSAVQCGTCKSLPNYSALIAAGWTTGY